MALKKGSGVNNGVNKSTILRESLREAVATPACRHNDGNRRATARGGDKLLKRRGGLRRTSLSCRSCPGPMTPLPPLVPTGKPYPQTDNCRRRRTIHFGHNYPSHARTIPPQPNPHRTAHTD